MKKPALFFLLILNFINIGNAQTWELLNPQPATSSIQDIFMLDSLNGWAVGDHGLVLHTSDFGATWTRQQTNTLRLLHQVSFCDEMHGWIATTAGKVLHTNNGGENWEMLDVPGNPYDFTTICCLNPDTILAAGTYNRVSKTTDGGETWTTTTLSRVSIYWPSRIFFPDLNRGYIVGGEQVDNIGQVFFSQDIGESWRVLETGLDLPYISDASFINSDTGILSTNRSPYIFRTFDEGNNWEAIQLDGPFTLNGFRSVSLLNGGKGFGQAWQAILKTINYGYSWDTTYIASIYSPTNTCMNFISSSEGLISGTSGAILKTEDTADHFNYSNSGFFNPISDIEFINNEKGWVCGSSILNFIPQRGMVAFTQDGGQTWEVKDPVGDGKLLDINFKDDLAGWACGYQGTIVNTTDGGNTWLSVDSPTDYTIYSIESHAGMIWIACADGQIFYSDDDGHSWVLQLHFEEHKLDHLTFFENNVGLAWGYLYNDPDSKILVRTLDDGQSWEECQIENVGPVREICCLHDSSFLLLNDNEDLFVSNNNGFDWEFIEKAPAGSINLSIMTPEIWWTAGGHELSYSLNQGEEWQTQTLYYPDIKIIVSKPDGNQWLMAGINMLHQVFDITQTGDKFITQNPVHVYPNPGSSCITLRIESSLKGGEFNLFNSSGQLLFSEPVNSIISVIDVQKLASGMYYYQYLNGNKKFSAKWVKY